MNKRNPKYFRDGHEISAAEALDHRGIVRDGVVMRMHMTGLDAVIDDKRRRKTVQRDPLGRELSTFEEENDAKRKRVLGPNGAIKPDEEETTERTESDAAPALLADGMTVADHRPHFGFADRATQDKLEAVRFTLDYLDSQRWRGGDSAPDTSDAVSVEDAYEAYDLEMNAQYLKGK